jgi:hypothetical protein
MHAVQRFVDGAEGTDFVDAAFGAAPGTRQPDFQISLHSFISVNGTSHEVPQPLYKRFRAECTKPAVLVFAPLCVKRDA